MTYYFSKWIEVEALLEIKSKDAISYIKRSIICKFSVPSEIVCDNGSQFVSDKKEAFCAKYNINLVKYTPDTFKLMDK